jgi:serine phosphatase RsbU (regulator of sigma subunit)
MPEKNVALGVGAVGRLDPGSPVADPFGRPLALPATGAEVAQFVALRAAACIGASYSNLALLNGARTSLRVFHGDFLDPDIAERYNDVSLDAPYPLAAAGREGRIVLLPDRAAYRDQFPQILADTVAAGVQATASVPLRRSDDTLLGVIGFAWTEPTVFDFKLRAALRAVAQLCAETVERAERYDAEHALIVELQTRLLGHLPTVPGIEATARYLPAGRVPTVGGDWYDGVSLGGSKLAVIVGDVTGHGLTAAADMALIRGMTTALLHAGVALEDVFSGVSRALVERPVLVLATAALAVVDAAAEQISFATAGHPPPLLRQPGGRVRTLDTANSSMIGLTGRPGRADTVPFARGSQLVMFTDGLVERRDRPFDAGVEEAADCLSSLPDNTTAPRVIDALLERLIPTDKAEDDIAIVVVEYTV